MSFFGKSKKDHDKTLAEGIRRAVFGSEFEDFVRYLRSPWSIMWSNFLGGVFRGLGIIIGMTLVVAFLIWLLTNLVDFPLLGSYFAEWASSLQQYTPQNGAR